MAGNLLLAGALLLLEQRAPGWLSRFILSTISGWLAIPVLFIAPDFIDLFQARTVYPDLCGWRWATCRLPSRQLRVLWLHQKETLYVQASRVLGSRSWMLFRKTIWPNLQPDVLGLAKLVFSFSVLEISGLAFLGPHWGSRFFRTGIHPAAKQELPSGRPPSGCVARGIFIGDSVAGATFAEPDNLIFLVVWAGHLPTFLAFPIPLP